MIQQEEQEAEGGLEVLEADLAEMENSVYHLVRSNVEIAQVWCPVKQQFTLCCNQAQIKAWMDVLLRSRACCAAFCLLSSVQGSFRRVFFPRCRLQPTQSSCGYTSYCKHSYTARQPDV